MKILYVLGIVKSCPNCESAWTGGHPNPEKIKWCLVCGPGPTGWVWGWIVPKFIRDRIMLWRLKEYQSIKEDTINAN